MVARSLALFALAAALVGCRTLAKAAPGRPPVEVTRIAATFPEPDRGVLELTLDVENRQGSSGSVGRVTWEVWLGGRWFAAGAQGVQAPLEAHQRRPIELSLPVVFRRLEVRAEPTRVEAAVRGWVEVSYGGTEDRLPFEATLQITAQGAPVLTGLNDAE